MTRRATVTQADLARAIRAADAAGKVVLVTQAGIAFVDPGVIAQTGPQQQPPESSGLDFADMRR